MPTAARFTVTVNRYRSARSRALKATEDVSRQIAAEDALAAVNRMAEAILAASARSPEALRVKALAFAWEIEGEDPDGFTLDGHRARALRGLLNDIGARR